MGQSKPTSFTQATESAESTDEIIELIEKLSKLNGAGVLTDDEFNSKKSELLSRI